MCSVGSVNGAGFSGKCAVCNMQRVVPVMHLKCVLCCSMQDTVCNMRCAGYLECVTLFRVCNIQCAVEPCALCSVHIVSCTVCSVQNMCAS